MLKTSALIAGIAGAGLGMMIGSATPASAAEIGVRHTWGNSTVNIRNGYSESKTIMNTEFSEKSSGWNAGVTARDFTATADTEFGATIETDVNPRRHPLGLDVDTVVIGGASTEVGVDGKLAVSYSEFSRKNSGTLETKAKSDYTFGGTENSGFSELSTFSR